MLDVYTCELHVLKSILNTQEFVVLFAILTKYICVFTGFVTYNILC